MNATAAPPSVASKTPSSSKPESKTRVRIAHVQLLPILSGVQKVTLDEFSLLNQRTFESHLVCQGPGAFPSAAEKWKVSAHFAPSLQRTISPVADYIAYRELVAIFRKVRPHIVHTHSSKTGLLGRLAAAKANVPVIVHTVHGFAFPATRSRVKKILFQGCERVGGRYCDATVCLNSNDESIATDRLGIPADRVFRIPNGVHLNQFQPIRNEEDQKARQAELFGTDSGPVVLMVGRLWRQKNPRMFVEAACRLLDQGIVARFFLAGDGPFYDELNQLIRDHGHQDRVRLLGWRNDVESLLPASDLFVLPSNWEGLPLVILEAAACGVPTVATDIPGNHDAVIDGHTGLLCEQNNSEDLAQKIKQLVNNEMLRKQMAVQSYSHAVANCDIQHRHDVITKLYADLLESKGHHQLADAIYQSPEDWRIPSPHAWKTPENDARLREVAESQT